MQTECSVHLFGFPAVEGRRVEAMFDASLATSDAGALLLGATDRVYGIALGYEDVDDHDHDE